MSTEIERRVVELEFQNHGFEASVKSSKKQLDKLNESLQFKGATKAVDDINTAVKGLNLTSIQTNVNKIAKSFSEMGIAGTVAIQRIVNSALTAGKNIVKSLTIDPVNMGLQEYETQMNAIQTILANTRSKGSTLDDVNRALDNLNRYSDKTIYNFTEMTRNIGTFTAAGVDLNTSVNAIQGIANLAAISGSNATQASTAMYQLSQALAAGRISLMDWNSVVNAGMGGEIFQTALKETSRALGTGVDAAIAAKGSFRESLQTGWLTSEVLTETLKKFTTSGAIEYVSKYTGIAADAVNEIYEAAKAEYGEAEAIEEASKQLAEKSGKNQKEIKDMLDFAQSAEDAATKVKTFSQLMDTLKEAVQSGWSQTWRLLIGDFEEAREMFTNISNVIGAVVEESANLRNAMLKVWKGLGGRTKLIEGLARVSQSVLDIWDSIKKAFIDVFYITGKELYGITEQFAEFTKELVASESTLQDIKRIVRAVASVFGVFGQIFTAVIRGVSAVFVYLKPLIAQVLRFAAIVGDVISIVGYVLKQTQIFNRLALAAARILAVIIELLENLGRIALAVGLILFDRMFSIVKMAVTLHNTINSAFGGVGGMILAIFAALGKRFPAFQKFMDAISPAFQKVAESAKEFTSSFGESFGSFANFVSQFSSAVQKALAAMFQSFSHLDSITFDGLVEGIRVFATTLENQFPRLTGFRELVDSILEALKTTFDALGSTVGPTVGKIVGFIGNVFNFLFSKTGIAILALGGIVGGLFALLYALTKTFDGFAKSVAGSISKVAGSITGYFKTLQKESQAKQMKNLAEAIFLMAAALTMLTFVDQDNLLSAAVTLGIFAAGLMILSGAISFVLGLLVKKGKIVETSMGKFDTAILSMAFAMVAVINAVKKIQDAMNEVQPEGGVTFIQALLVLTGAFIVLSTLATLLAVVTSKWNPQATKTTISYVLQLLGIAMAIKILGTVKNLGPALLALVAVEVLLLGMMAVIGIINKFLPGAAAVKWGVMLAAVASLILISNHMLLLSFIPWQVIMNGFGKMSILLVAFAALMFAGSKITSGYAAKTIIALGGTFLSLVLAVKILSRLNGHEIAHGTAGVVALMGPLALMLLIGRMAGRKLRASAQTVVAMAGILATMSLCAALLSLLDPAPMIRGAAAIGVLGAVAGGMIYLTRFGNKAKEGVKTISAITAFVGVLTGCVIAISFIDIPKAIVGLAGISVVILSMVAVIKALDGFTAGKNMWITLGAMSAAMVVISAILWALSALNVDPAISAVAGVSVLLLTLAASMKIIGNKKLKFKKSNWTGFLIMGASMVAIAGVLVGLQYLNVDASIKTVGAMGVLLLEMAWCMKIIGKDQLSFNKNNWVGLGVMVTALVGVGAALWALNTLNIDASIETVASLAALLLEMTLCMKILGQSSLTFDDNIWTGLGAMGSMLAGIAFVLAILGALKTDVAWSAVASLGLLLIEMTFCMKLLSGTEMKFDIHSIQGAVAMAIALVGIAGAMALLSVAKVDLSIETVAGMALLLISLAVVTKLLSKIDFMGSLYAAAGVLLVGVALGLLLLAFSSLFGAFDHNFIVNGAQTLGDTIGALINGIVGGIGSGVSSLMPQIAADLSKFMENLQGFISYASGDTGAGIDWGGMFAMLGWLATAAIMAPLAVTLPILGAGLVGLADGLKKFFDTMVDMDNERLSIFGQLVSSLGTLSVGLILFNGGSLKALSDGLPALGDNIVIFCNKIADANVDRESALSAISIFGAMAEAAKNIPREGGLIGMVFGDIDISGFITAMGAAGPAIKSFYESTQDMDSTKVDGALDILKKTIEVASTIPNSGGWLGMAVGDNDLGAFCAQMRTAGPDIKTFSEAVAGLKYSSVDGALKILAKTVDVASDIPNTGGWLVAGVVGENDLDEFCKEMASAGPNIATFVDAVDEVDATKATGALSVLDATIRCAQGIPNEGLSVASIFVGDNTLDKFAQGMATAAPYLVEFLTAFNDLGRHVRTADGTMVAIDDASEIFDAASKAVSVLSSSIWAAKNIASTENWDDTALTTMSTDLAAAAPNLATFFNAIAGIDIEGENMQAKVNAMTAFMNNITRITGLGDTTLPDFSKLNGENTVYALAEGMVAATESQSVMDMLSTVSGNVVGSIENVMVGQPMVDAANVGISTLKNKLIDYVNYYGVDFVGIGEDIVNDIKIGFMGKPVDEATKMLAESLVAGTELALDIDSPSGKFKEIGQYIIAGLDLGLQNGTPEVEKTTSRMASALENQFRDDMGIHSPSSLFTQFGTYIVDGLKNGLASGGSMQDIIGSVLGGINFDSFGSFGTDIANIFSGTFDNIDLSSFSVEGLEDGTFVDGLLSKIQDQMDQEGLTAEISAVFDADELQAQIDAATAGTTGTIGTTGTYGVASSTMSSFVNTQFDDGQSKNEGEKNTFQFVQNNYSPKELDRIAIYRQTRNQFAAMKEVITKR